jgi:hypothetical protein
MIIKEVVEALGAVMVQEMAARMEVRRVVFMAGGLAGGELLAIRLPEGLALFA